MRIRVLLSVVLALVFVVGTAFAADSVMVMKDKMGTSYLTDSKGMTLYSFKNDQPDLSMCKDACAAKWPAFYDEKPMLPKGLDAKDFGSITREDGKMQTTFRGMPLYYFSDDKNKGDMNGQGFKNFWHTVDPATFMMKK